LSRLCKAARAAAEVATLSVSIKLLRPAIVSAFERHPAEWAAANSVIGGSVDEALVGFAGVYNLFVREPGGNLPDQNGDKKAAAALIQALKGTLLDKVRKAPTAEVITALCKVRRVVRTVTSWQRAWRACLARRDEELVLALSELS
jgi:hypothetical protein